MHLNTRTRLERLIEVYLEEYLKKLVAVVKEVSFDYPGIASGIKFIISFYGDTKDPSVPDGDGCSGNLLCLFWLIFVICFCKPNFISVCLS